jgi:indole-3-glycerol phosphate synthase
VLDFLVNIRSRVDELIANGYYSETDFKKQIPRFKNVLDDNFLIISELKVASPTNPNLLQRPWRDQLQQIAQLSNAISIITQPHYFQGALEYLYLARKYNLPLLMKDFISEKIQILAGLQASCFLLIKQYLSDEKLVELKNFIKIMDREIIIEIDNETDFLKAVELKPDMIGINNRNLKSLKVDTSLTTTILKEYSIDTPIIALSGYENIKQIQDVKRLGANGVLIGTRISEEENPKKFLQELQNALIQEEN